MVYGGGSKALQDAINQAASGAGGEGGGKVPNIEGYTPKQSQALFDRYQKLQAQGMDKMWISGGEGGFNPSGYISTGGGGLGGSGGSSLYGGGRGGLPGLVFGMAQGLTGAGRRGSTESDVFENKLEELRNRRS